jgi:hypothetical protein
MSELVAEWFCGPNWTQKVSPNDWLNGGLSSDVSVEKDS